MDVPYGSNIGVLDLTLKLKLRFKVKDFGASNVEACYSFYTYTRVLIFCMHVL